MGHSVTVRNGQVSTEIGNMVFIFENSALFYCIGRTGQKGHKKILMII
jgi:hypothetical protein